MIHQISDVELHIGSTKWPFAEQQKLAIGEHWAKSVEKNPTLWNGKLLLARSLEISGTRLSANLIEVDYASYTAWRDWGYPDKSHFAVFGSAVIRSREGYLVFGKMAEHTAGDGLIYPPAGSLELSDLGTSGRVDVFASAVRELAEETGLNANVAQASGDFVSWAGQLISVTRVYQFDRTGDELMQRIGDHLASEARPELSELILLKTISDIDQVNTEPYAVGIAEHLLGLESS